MANNRRLNGQDLGGPQPLQPQAAPVDTYYQPAMHPVQQPPSSNPMLELAKSLSSVHGNLEQAVQYSMSNRRPVEEQPLTPTEKLDLSQKLRSERLMAQQDYEKQSFITSGNNDEFTGWSNQRTQSFYSSLNPRQQKAATSSLSEIYDGLGTQFSGHRSKLENSDYETKIGNQMFNYVQDGTSDEAAHAITGVLTDPEYGRRLSQEQQERLATASIIQGTITKALTDEEKIKLMQTLGSKVLVHGMPLSDTLYFKEEVHKSERTIMNEFESASNFNRRAVQDEQKNQASDIMIEAQLEMLKNPQADVTPYIQRLKTLGPIGNDTIKEILDRSFTVQRRDNMPNEDPHVVVQLHQSKDRKDPGLKGNAAKAFVNNQIDEPTYRDLVEPDKTPNRTFTLGHQDLMKSFKKQAIETVPERGYSGRIKPESTQARGEIGIKFQKWVNGYIQNNPNATEDQIQDYAEKKVIPRLQKDYKHIGHPKPEPVPYVDPYAKPAFHWPWEPPAQPKPKPTKK